MKVGRVMGIPIRLHWSFGLLVLGSGLVSLSAGGWSAGVQNLLLLGGLFFCVILHEFGHALMARRFGVSTAHVTLYPFGGIAALRGLPNNATAEFWIAIAGPLVNLGLMVFGALLWWMTAWTPILLFTGMNLVMGIFNLIPAFPMDGGRVLRAALSPLFGWVRASRIAIGVGRCFAILFLAVGLWIGSLNLLLVGGFLLFATVVEGRRLGQIRNQVHQQQSAYPYVPRWRLHPRA